MTYKAIIFDLDGTLVNSIEDIADAMNTVLKSYNYPTHSYENYKNLVGSGIKNLVVNALPEYHRSELEINTCFEAMMKVYSLHCTNKTKPYKNIIELLNRLKSKQLKLGILSNKADVLTKKVVSTLFIDYFEIVLGLKIEADKKPNPNVALEICMLLDALPKETIFVGDTNIDMQTANNANMLAVGVAWGFRDKKELIDNGAKHILNTPMDLVALL
ncbi:HAD family hydrolase [Algibacter lectus]|uniref:HAD family hydrolase n=1 Tax=Algibacter lectus TaxID=221126 RepID=UPI0026EC5F09|nr:HAD family hydrolase [Algibacter lectus]MDO7138964.1 HAD family hydrolase [Algibacter lectus]